MNKRLISAVLLAAMILSCVSGGLIAFAEETNTVTIESVSESVGNAASASGTAAAEALPNLGVAQDETLAAINEQLTQGVLGIAGAIVENGTAEVKADKDTAEEAEDAAGDALDTAREERKEAEADALEAWVDRKTAQADENRAEQAVENIIETEDAAFAKDEVTAAEAAADDAQEKADSAAAAAVSAAENAKAASEAAADARTAAAVAAQAAQAANIDYEATKVQLELDLAAGLITAEAAEQAAADALKKANAAEAAMTAADAVAAAAAEAAEQAAADAEAARNEAVQTLKNEAVKLEGYVAGAAAAGAGVAAVDAVLTATKTAVGVMELIVSVNENREEKLVEQIQSLDAEIIAAERKLKLAEDELKAKEGSAEYEQAYAEYTEIAGALETARNYRDAALKTVEDSANANYLHWTSRWDAEYKKAQAAQQAIKNGDYTDADVETLTVYVMSNIGSYDAETRYEDVKKVESNEMDNLFAAKLDGEDVLFQAKVNADGYLQFYTVEEKPTVVADRTNLPKNAKDYDASNGYTITYKGETYQLVSYTASLLSGKSYGIKTGTGLTPYTKVTINADGKAVIGGVTYDILDPNNTELVAAEDAEATNSNTIDQKWEDATGINQQRVDLYNKQNALNTAQKNYNQLDNEFKDLHEKIDALNKTIDENPDKISDLREDLADVRTKNDGGLLDKAIQAVLENPVENLSMDSLVQILSNAVGGLEQSAALGLEKIGIEGYDGLIIHTDGENDKLKKELSKTSDEENIDNLAAQIAANNTRVDEIDSELEFINFIKNLVNILDGEKRGEAWTELGDAYSKTTNIVGKVGSVAADIQNGTVGISTLMNFLDVFSNVGLADSTVLAIARQVDAIAQGMHNDAYGKFQEAVDNVAAQTRLVAEQGDIVVKAEAALIAAKAAEAAANAAKAVADAAAAEAKRTQDAADIADQAAKKALEDYKKLLTDVRSDNAADLAEAKQAVKDAEAAAKKAAAEAAAATANAAAANVDAIAAGANALAARDAANDAREAAIEASRLYDEKFSNNGEFVIKYAEGCKVYDKDNNLLEEGKDYEHAGLTNWGRVVVMFSFEQRIALGSGVHEFKSVDAKNAEHIYKIWNL